MERKNYLNYSNMKKFIVKIKNKFGIHGTYKWALKQMKEGAFIKSDKLKTGYMIFYDYEYNSLMVGRGYFGKDLEAFIFADEFLYQLMEIDNFYITAIKKISLKETTLVKRRDTFFSDDFKITSNAFIE